ncbi:MAG: asparaginase [Janthinobacterium lividum]
MSGIVLITTGGTIASRYDRERGVTVATVGGDELRKSLHDTLDGIEITIDEFCNIGSFAFDLPLAYDLAMRINQHVQDAAVRGVVVTHGTDTMEESAYMADLLLRSDKPVVFTGAQRSADSPDTDGPRNIADSVRIAYAENARGLGAMIAFEQDFHAARDVTKTHASRVDTFASGEHGKLGEIDEGRVAVYRHPVLRRSFDTARIEPNVELVKLVMGSNGKLVRFAAKSGAKAIVLEGFGRGNATPAAAEAVRDVIATGTPVIVTSRCPQGRVRPIYGNGGGADLERAGAIFAGDLSGPKARILAAVVLGAGLEEDSMREVFAELGGS